MELPPDQAAIRARCFHPTGRFVEFPEEDVMTTIPARFAKIARKHPDKLALKKGTTCLTYGELSQLAARVNCKVLRALGNGSEPVAFLLDQRTSVAGVILGILGAGKFYVPLDPSYPRRRNQFVLADSGARLIVTDGNNAALARELSQGALRVLSIEDTEVGQPDGLAPPPVSPGDPAWLLYTSGTTGQPKGVIQNHRNVLHFIRNYTNSIHICSDDRLSLLRYASSFGATRDILAAVLNGAGLYLFDVKKDGVGSLAHGLSQEKITVCFFGAPLFRSFLDTLRDADAFPDLRVIRLGSDAVKKRDVERFQQRFPPECILVNGLASTETATVCKFFIVKETKLQTDTVPVGYPMENTQILLLDETGNEVGPGEVGTIAIRSRYLALEYWREPELTAAVFWREPQGDGVRTFKMGDLGRLSPDGLLEHLGRRDSQTKIRGYRVNTSEVEGVLLELDTVKDAAVVVRSDSTGEARLVAYVVPAVQPGPGIDQLRMALRELVPDYMIPSAVILMERLPLNANGKLDRRALPSPDARRPTLASALVAPTDPVQERLARIWEEVLDVRPVGIHDNFFDLGGHSLAATRVISRVINQFQLELPLQALFESPTVAKMAEVVMQYEPMPVRGVSQRPRP